MAHFGSEYHVSHGWPPADDFLRLMICLPIRSGTRLWSDWCPAAPVPLVSSFFGMRAANKHWQEGWRTFRHLSALRSWSANVCKGWVLFSCSAGHCVQSLHTLSITWACMLTLSLASKQGRLPWPHLPCMRETFCDWIIQRKTVRRWIAWQQFLHVRSGFPQSSVRKTLFIKMAPLFPPIWAPNKEKHPLTATCHMDGIPRAHFTTKAKQWHVLVKSESHSCRAAPQLG